MQKLFGLGAKNIVLGVLRKFVFQTEKFGFPNITGGVNTLYGEMGDSTAAYGSVGKHSGKTKTMSFYWGTSYVWDIDASRSSSLYGEIQAVQVNSIRLLNCVRI